MRVRPGWLEKMRLFFLQSGGTTFGRWHTPVSRISVHQPCRNSRVSRRSSDARSIIAFTPVGRGRWGTRARSGRLLRFADDSGNPDFNGKGTGRDFLLRRIALLQQVGTRACAGLCSGPALREEEPPVTGEHSGWPLVRRVAEVGEGFGTGKVSGQETFQVLT